MNNPWHEASPRIVDLGDGIAASYATRLLADFGADVVKIEPFTGDSLRAAGPFPADDAGPERSGMFAYLNAGKRSVALDVRKPEGAEVLSRLLSSADVVVESHGPGWFDSLSLQGVFGRLVVCSISPYGLDGPKARYRASDLGVYAAGGMLYITGDGSREPVLHGLHQAAHLAGVNAASASLAALMLARLTGEGQRIDVSEQETVAMTIFPALNIYSHTGGVMRRAPSGIASLVNSSPMETADGYIMPSYAGLGDWQTLSSFLDLPELMDERFTTPESRLTHAGEIDTLVGPVFRSRSKRDLFHEGQEWRLTFTAVQDARDLAECPHLHQREYFRSCDVDGREVRMPGRVPAEAGHATPAVLGRPPHLGEHSFEVLTALGVGAAEWDHLRASGVVR